MNLHITCPYEYSLLDGSSKIKEITKRAKELGMNSLAITDHGVMYGCIDFYRAALENGIKPIIGCEVYVAPGSRFEKEAGDKRRQILSFEFCWQKIMKDMQTFVK